MNTLKRFRDTDYLFSKHSNSVGRQSRKFPSDKYFWMDKLLRKISYRWNNRMPSKTHTETKRRTWILLTLVSSIFFYHGKNYLLFFLFSSKYFESTCFLKQCTPIEDSSPREDDFPPSVVWPSINTKTFVQANIKCKKYEFDLKK